jgi:HAD superfamily hydrolase (TIGR01484 family)
MGSIKIYGKIYQLTLATDLDGTFLEGDHRIKSIFYNELLRLRDEVMLIYVTGRPVSTVANFCKNGYLPAPHFVIGDHGTHVVDGKNFSPIEPLQTAIVEKWNNGNHKLKELLQHDPGIELQPIDPPYRVAYYYNPNYFHYDTVNKITNAGYDVILSCESYLDIVPKGINKGVTLLNLLNQFGLAHDTVITCGDSLNDLSLFQTGLKSVAVGNAEPKLVSEIESMQNVYFSSHHGLLGVIDGLAFYNQMTIFNMNS